MGAKSSKVDQPATQHSPEMASRVVSPETPPESGECCLFKLPPELRVVIYNMVFEGLCFDGEEGSEDAFEDRIAARREGLLRVLPVTGDEDSVEDTDQEEEKGMDEDGGGESSGNDESNASREQEHNKINNEEQQDDTLPAADSQENDGSLRDLHLTRPPLLRTCRQIRGEAIPVYSNALILVAAKTVKTVNDIMKRQKEGFAELEGSLDMLYVLLMRVAEIKLRGIVNSSMERVHVILREVAFVGKSVAGSVGKSKDAERQLIEAVKEFGPLSAELLHLDAEVDNAV